MKSIIRLRYVILAVWLVGAMLLTVFQPDINKIISQKGQGTISKEYSSRVAQELLTKMSNSKGNSAVLVFYNQNKLSEKDMNEIKTGLENIKASQKELSIIEMITHFDNPRAKDQLVSKDETTVLVPVTYELKEQKIEAMGKKIEDKLSGIHVEHYITGGDFIKHDFMEATFKGVDRSAIITVLFILIVLFLVFRSVVTPVVSLLTVGISYLCSMGIVSQLIYHFDFPVTSLTQMFLILVLFGIGTDYNILLFNRFKEELSHRNSVDEAIFATYRTAGKTIMYSGLTVLIAFASLSFSEFDVYRSGNAVAVGIFILFLELLTLTPLFMKLLGHKLFWPAHNTSGHKESRLWEAVTSASVKHPIITMIVVFVVLAPVIYFNNQKLSFDSLKEMDSSYPSVKGFQIVAEHFSRGKSMPSTIVLRNDQPMDNNEALAVIDKLTDKIKGMDGVKEVSGPTQPQGSPIDKFYTSDQTKLVVNGLSSTNDGVGKIFEGLNLAKEQLVAPDFSKVSDMVKGTGDIHKGLLGITEALKQVESGIGEGAKGAGSISEGIDKIKGNLSKISTSTEQLSQGYNKLQAGYVQFQGNYKNIEKGLGGIEQAVTGMKGLIAKLEASYSQLASDSSFITLKKMAEELEAGLMQMSAGMKQLNSEFEKTNLAFQKTNEGLKALGNGQNQIVAGLGQLQSGSMELSKGLEKGSMGQSVIVTNMEKLTAGLSKIKDGQQQLNNGLSGLGGGMEKLKDGLGASTDGLKSISDGLSKTNSFLSQLTNSKTFFIPKEALESADFKNALDAYMSKDRKIVKLIVTLTSDPYSSGAIKTVDAINNALEAQIKGTVLAKAEFGTAGETSATNDLNKIASNDITKTQVIVLIGVFLVLILVIRSFWIPVYIIASLMAAYYTSMTITGLITDHVFKLDGIAWNVPFFSFVIIVALGVDYSIFLMMRFNEYKNHTASEAMVYAAKHTGGVVISAAIILAGTFLTLYPSGIQTLMQMAISVSVGLLMLSMVLLPVALPAMIALPDKLTFNRSNRSSINMDMVEEG